jgi:hypothetical protein
MTESVMAFDSFLRLKGRTTYFRRKVPGDLLSRLASTEICFKLGVIDRDSAVQLGRRLAVAVDAFFVSARRDKMLSSPDLSRVDKVDSQIGFAVIQDCFLGGGFGTWGFVGRRVAAHWGAFAS